jgi:hypothetical protein
MLLLVESYAIFFIVIILSMIITRDRSYLIFKAFYTPKRITESEFDLLMRQPDPCAQITDIKLIYTLPKDEIAPAINRLALLKCFDKEEPFLRAFEAAIESKHEKSMIYPLIPVALIHHTSTIPLLFNKCASNRFYLCVSELLYYNPLTEYEGKNIIHFATLLDDLILLEIAPLTSLYLHLKDNDGNIPTKYVISPEIYNQILRRSAVEAERSPYPKEHQANMDYLHKSKELGFRSGINKRLQFMFINPSWVQFNSQLELEVSRDTVFMNSYKALHNLWLIWYTPNFYGSSFISFKEEGGIDRGGVTNEWLSLLLENIFKANPGGSAKSFTAPLFQPISDDSDIYQPTGLYDPSVYKFAGSIIAMAMTQGITTRVEFIPSLYRLILEIEPYRSEDLQIQSPIVYKNLNSLRDLFKSNTPIIDQDFKSIEEVEEYIKTCSADLLYENHKEFLKAFAEGFRSKIPRKISKYLDLVDLKKVLKGHMEVSTSEFKKNIKFISESFWEENMFLEIIDEMTQEERFKLIKFITGRQGLPFGGLSELPEPICVYFNSLSFGKLPKSSTCFSHLILPMFNTAEQLEGPLLKAIEYCDTLEDY